MVHARSFTAGTCTDLPIAVTVRARHLNKDVLLPAAQCVAPTKSFDDNVIVIVNRATMALNNGRRFKIQQSLIIIRQHAIVL